jgi:hypothetical protein
MSQQDTAFRPVTFRVEGLPWSRSFEDARMLIEAALRPNLPGNASILLHSLAKSVITKGNMTATITCDCLSTSLLDASRSSCWTFEIRASEASAGHEGRRPNMITLDTTFDGFTPLNSFDNEEEHKFEYVCFFDL